VKIQLREYQEAVWHFEGKKAVSKFCKTIYVKYYRILNHVLFLFPSRTHTDLRTVSAVYTKFVRFNVNFLHTAVSLIVHLQADSFTLCIVGKPSISVPDLIRVAESVLCQFRWLAFLRHMSTAA